ncbi:MAG: hydantoinase B/oxoprolinase family protein [Fimbriimonadaceae bacterium]|nr:hydantoinase B/oxoprolinase family protein [Alphaproteobacteria bacterium]
MTARQDIDPILVSVLQRRLKSITEEMGLTLLRTTRSPILNEARDFVTGLYDAKGRMLEQTEYIPVLAFALQPVCEHIVEYFGDDIAAGDVIIHNDVFTHGNQNADVAIFKPIFWEDQLVAWAACKGHQADIGGAVAGGYNPEAREVWQEALRIPAVKIYEKGKLRRDVWDLIFANVRYDVVQEDIKAQIGGCVVGERGVTALFARYGTAIMQSHIEHLFASTERIIRKEIEAIPDGTYVGESIAFYDGVRDGSEMNIKLAVTIKGDEVTFDFTGSSPQTPGFVNAPFSATASAVMLTFLMLINPDIPHNDGLHRPLKIINPVGSFLNAAYPAATTFGNSITGPTSDAIFRAFADALPGMVSAGWNRSLNFVVVGKDPRHELRSYVDILFLALKGGSGATENADGFDHIGLINCAGGLQDQDYEMFEIQNPHLLLKHELLANSAGPGKWRGGYGTECTFIINGKDVTGIAFGDGLEDGARAFGLFGGQPGSRNELEIEYPDGTVRKPKTKEVIRNIPTGSVYRQRAGGGGGFGNPYQRTPEQVAKEVHSELISPAQAKSDYGVAVDPETYTVDADETRQLRSGNR